MALNKRGVGAALTSIGQGMEDFRKEEAEKRRHEEATAREERRLKMQEEDAKQRREMNNLKIQMQKAQWNNEQLMKAAATSEYNPAAMGKALTQYMPDGHVWDYNDIKSVKNEDGSYKEIVFDMGAYKSKGAGVMGTGGVPEKQAYPGGLGVKKFVTDDESTAQEKFVRFITATTNPNAIMAMQLQEMTAEKNLENAEKIHKKRLETDPDYALKYGQQKDLDALKVAQARENVEKTKAETAKLKREPKGTTTPAQAPVSTFKSFSGKMKKQTAKDVDKAKQFAASLNKSGNYQTTLDADDAARIMDIKNDPKAQKLINSYRSKIKAGEMTIEEFSEKFDGTDLPQEFINQMYTRAESMSVKADEGSFWDFLPFVGK